MSKVKWVENVETFSKINEITIIWLMAFAYKKAWKLLPFAFVEWKIIRCCKQLPQFIMLWTDFFCSASVLTENMHITSDSSSAHEKSSSILNRFLHTTTEKHIKLINCSPMNHFAKFYCHTASAFSFNSFLLFHVCFM